MKKTILIAISIIGSVILLVGAFVAFATTVNKEETVSSVSSSSSQSTSSSSASEVVRNVDLDMSGAGKYGKIDVANLTVEKVENDGSKTGWTDAEYNFDGQNKLPETYYRVTLTLKYTNTSNLNFGQNFWKVEDDQGNTRSVLGTTLNSYVYTTMLFDGISAGNTEEGTYVWLTDSEPTNYSKLIFSNDGYTGENDTTITSPETITVTP